MDNKRVDKYKQDKNVEYLYFRKKDIGKYVRFHNYIAKKCWKKNLLIQKSK